MLKYSVKQGCSINFIAGSSWKDDEVVMERLMGVDLDVPESLKAYQNYLVRPKVNPTDKDEDL